MEKVLKTLKRKGFGHRDNESGRALLEMLFAALIVGLMAAGWISSVTQVMDKVGDPSNPEEMLKSPLIKKALSQWLVDSESLERLGDTEGSALSMEDLLAGGGEQVDFDREKDGEAYEETVRELESAGLLDEWLGLLQQSEISGEHPLIQVVEESGAVRLEQGRSRDDHPTEESVVLETSRIFSDSKKPANDPEMSWSDGEPVMIADRP